MRRPLHLAAACALLAGPAPAQFINRATWLGTDEEPFRRDYGQDEEYFMDRWSYVAAPPWWRGETLDPFANRLFVGGGSVTSTRLTLEAIANVGIDMGSGFTARVNYLQSEHQTTQFQRIALGIDKSLSDSTAIFVQLEGTPNKSRADIGFGVELFRSERSAHRLGFTLVDFSSQKSATFEYERSPYALSLAGFAGDPDGFDLTYELGYQLPFEERELEAQQVLRLDRLIGGVQARTRLSARDRLILGLDGELTHKELVPEGPGDPAAEDGDVEKARVSVEWWRQGARELEYSFGAYYLHLDEDYLRPNDAQDDLVTRRRELMLFSRAHLALGGRWSLEPYVIGGRVDLERQEPDLSPDQRRFEGLQAKLGAPLRLDFSERAWLRVDLSMQLDEFAFGGGGVQLAATF